MDKFTIEGFAKGCKAAMAEAKDRREAARAYLEGVLRTNPASEIIEVLEAAIPAGASIGEMIVHQSAELTMLYARIPGRFKSGIHNHTVFATIGQLSGAERNTVYRKTEDGKSLSVDSIETVHPGEVLSLPEDAIHHIENPTTTTSASLHVYGGDFNAVMEDRSLWSFEDLAEKSFSFPELLRESVQGMKLDGNDVGIAELVKAIPAARGYVDA